ncbi:MAG: hypothetical protein IJJ32_01510 [Eggerthellaceae bacterium]|nr:hypothetical protein [Eggerthellaceae bacterium]
MSNSELSAQGEAQAKDFAALAEDLEGASRRARQSAASVFARQAKEDPESVLPYGASFVDALHRPEAQTRWECLDALTQLVPLDSRLCDKAIVGAESALFDEDSGTVRLAAMRFLCALGATTQKRSEKVWPYIDEDIQCYHGDLEFQDMLNAVMNFSAGKISAHVKEQLLARMAFDAENGKGALGRKAQAIIANLQ